MHEAHHYRDTKKGMMRKKKMKEKTPYMKNKVREKSRECHNHKPQPRPQEEEETDKSKQAQIEQTYEKH